MIKRTSRYDSIKEYVTKDGSVIRECMHPNEHGNEKLSVAEARVAPGKKTKLHSHLHSEEIYMIISGKGWMCRGRERFAIEKGMFVAIMPGEVHNLENGGSDDLVVLCCCAPAYGHSDTVLAEED